MGGNYLAQATIFLVELFFDIFILAFFLRYLFTVVRVDLTNPLSALIIKITNPFLKPLRRTIPGYLGVDWSSILVLVLGIYPDLILSTIDNVISGL